MKTIETIFYLCVSFSLIINNVLIIPELGNIFVAYTLKGVTLILAIIPCYIILKDSLSNAEKNKKEKGKNDR